MRNLSLGWLRQGGKKATETYQNLHVYLEKKKIIFIINTEANHIHIQWTDPSLGYMPIASKYQGLMCHTMKWKIKKKMRKNMNKKEYTLCSARKTAQICLMKVTILHLPVSKPSQKYGTENP